MPWRRELETQNPGAHNRAHPSHDTPDAQRPALHRSSVDRYWARLLGPEGGVLLLRARGELRGRRLACHCVGRPVVDAAGERVTAACLPCHAHSLAAVANCTDRQLQQLTLSVCPASPASHALRHTSSPSLQERPAVGVHTEACEACDEPLEGNDAPAPAPSPRAQARAAAPDDRVNDCPISISGPGVSVVVR